MLYVPHLYQKATLCAKVQCHLQTLPHAAHFVHNNPSYHRNPKWSKYSHPPFRIRPRVLLRRNIRFLPPCGIMYRHSLPVPTKPHLLRLHRSPLLQKLPLSARPAPPFSPVPEGRPSPPPRMPAQKPCLPLRSAQAPSHNNFSSYFSLTFICTFFIPNANKFLFSSQTEKSTAHIRQCSFFCSWLPVERPCSFAS